MESCDNCRFWFRTGTPDHGHGWCRRHAPTALINPDLSDHWPEACWPATAPKDWCGDYQPKPQEERKLFTTGEVAS